MTRSAALADVIAGIALLGLAAYVVVASAGFREDAGLVPAALGWIIGAGSILLIAINAVRLGTRRRAPADAGEESALRYLLPLTLLLMTILYVFLLPRLGFYIASALYIPSVLGFLGMKTPWIYIVTVAFFLGLLYLVFERTFRIPLPPPTWF